MYRDGVRRPRSPARAGGMPPHRLWALGPGHGAAGGGLPGPQAPVLPGARPARERGVVGVGGLVADVAQGCVVVGDDTGEVVGALEPGLLHVDPLTASRLQELIGGAVALGSCVVTPILFFCVLLGS